MAPGNSPRLSVTFIARKMSEGYYFHCLTCQDNINQTIITEDDIENHMARRHRNRIVRYWMMKDNNYTNSFNEYCNWMDSELNN